MALRKKGRYWYGTETNDTRAEVARYSRLNGHEAVKFSQAVCACGSHSFRLEADEEDGVAKRTCSRCGATHLMGDGAGYAAKATLEGQECVCSASDFELCSGVALYDGSNDVRWYYVGCRCTKCHLVGVFADWKCEAGDSDAFLADT